MWWWSAAFAAAPCQTSKDGAEVLSLLQKLDGDQRFALAAAFLAAACELPTALDQAFEQVQSVPADMRRLVVLRAAPADPALILTACTGGPRALAEVASLAPTEHRKHLWTSCGLERHAAVDERTFLAATAGDPIAYVLAAQAVGASASDPVVKEALRALAGAPASR